MNELKLNVYDKDGKVTKEVSANMIDLEFGTVRAIMELLNIESIADTGDLLKTVYTAWNELTAILDRCFEGMTGEDWEHVRLKELIPLLMWIFRYSFAEMLSIPSDPKN